MSLKEFWEIHDKRICIILEKEGVSLNVSGPAMENSKIEDWEIAFAKALKILKANFKKSNK